MSKQAQASIALVIGLIILPVLIVQAQSEGEVAQPPAQEAAVAAEESTASAETEAAPETAQASEPAAVTEDAPQEDAETTSAPESETPPTEGEVLGAEDVAAPDAALATTTGDQQALTGAASTTLVIDPTASSTATSTPPVEEPMPIEEPFVLQPGVELSINGNTVNAAIMLQNLTCKSCDKVLPELEVLAYYTEWYPNDGPVADYSEASVHAGKQARSVGDLPNGAMRDLTWSAEVPPGHYYFVVEVDSENAYGAYRLFRSEFAI